MVPAGGHPGYDGSHHHGVRAGLHGPQEVIDRRPVATGVLASPGANTSTSAFAIGLPSGVANCAVTSCVANRLKAAVGGGPMKTQAASVRATNPSLNESVRLCI